MKLKLFVQEFFHKISARHPTLEVLLGHFLMADILIIGAGAAGIAAATKLLENGFSKVKILEGENRIGGRIHTVSFGDAFVDLGAEEVHGEKDNIVVQLAEDYLRNETPLTKSTCYYSDGTRIEEDLCNKIFRFIEDFCEDDDKTEGTIGEVFLERFNSRILGRYKNDPELLKKLTEFLPLCESFNCVFKGCFSWFDVIKESESYAGSCEGVQFIGWNGHGYQTILDILMRKNSGEEQQILFDYHIELNKIVDKIEWSLKDRAKITCKDGSIYTADHVIFTPSAGVLREYHKEVFEPQLPQNKIDVLKKIGFSNVMKVALKFPKKWWHGDPFAFVWSDEEHQVPIVGYSWLTSVHWLTKSPDNDQVLIAWLTGPATPWIEQLSNDEIKEGIYIVLKKFLGKDFDIPEPDAIIPTRWNSNPNFCGAYSYETVEASKMEIPFQKILEEPLLNENMVPRVCFAGEATHPTYYSTVNGALLSGYREAERLMDIYRE